LRNALGGIIQVLSVTTEKRDPYTAGHQKRVADLARAIGQEMGLAVERVEGLRLAGTIHDIGKISIPAEILSKPTRLTKIEFNLIQVHPQVGYDILQNIDFSWPIAKMILQHHERMNGSGYPQGLKGENILLEARILAVSDVVEAMASYRPYRPALGIEAALEEIEKNKGVLYDPDVVSACLALFREKGFEFK
jgi:putative nucleotidyltransferase with HDIG domain